MTFKYYTGASLASLFPALYGLQKEERRQLQPQTPQTIIVGSLDTEAYVRREFLARDGILMGVNFPFLESAIENFSARILSGASPGGSENWFSPPGTTLPNRAGPLELEITALSLILDRKNSGILSELGFAPEKANPALEVQWARKIAARIGEYLLHLPDEMSDFAAGKARATPPIGMLWQKMRKALVQMKFQSTLYDPALLSGKIKPESQRPSSLYLFGMPILSAYHAKILAAISRKIQVHLFTTDLSETATGDDRHLQIITGKFAAYRKVLRDAALAAKTEFLEEDCGNPGEKSRVISIWAFPGKWRAAEILADHWCDILQKNPELYQDDIAVVLTSVQETRTAFERAAAARSLTVHSLAGRRMEERPHAHAELMNTLLKITSSGLSRTLLAEYLTNGVIRQAAQLDAEKTSLFTRAIERANAYRDDYGDSLAVFNFREGLTRILRGFFMPPELNAEPESPAATWHREFENHETLGEFFQAVWYPLQRARELGKKNGQELFAALGAFMESSGFSSVPGYADFFAVTEKVRIASEGLELSFSHLCRILDYHVRGENTGQATTREGIALSPTTAAAGKPYMAFFDLNEHLDTSVSPADPWLSEFDKAPTVLKENEQTHIALEAALASGAREIILGYSEFSPAKGAEEYPSQALTLFAASLARRGQQLAPAKKFPMTILEAPQADTPPLAANNDITTLQLLLGQKEAGISIGDLLRPRIQESESAQIQASELMRYLTRPTVAKLGKQSAIESDIVDFSREEPGIALSEKNRLKFCENYVLGALGQNPVHPLDVLAGLERRGKHPPEAFDRMRSLLARENNARTLLDLGNHIRDNFRAVEYILHPDVESAFSAQESDRLVRRYLPAPQFEGTRVTGTLGVFVQSTDTSRLELWQSAIYPERSVSLVRLYLQLILLAHAGESPAGGGIDLCEYKFTLKKGSEILGIKKSVSARIDLARIESGPKYAAELVRSFKSGPLVWFDLEFIKPTARLTNAADLDETQFHEQMAAEPRTRNAREADFLRRYFALESDTHSFAFFDQFIRPVARIDAGVESP